MENIDNLCRKDLQALAKVHGIKANLASAEIIAQLKVIEQPKVEEATVEETVPEVIIDESMNKIDEHTIELTEIEVTEITSALVSNPVAESKPTLTMEENMVTTNSSSAEENLETIPCTSCTKNVEDCSPGDEVEVLVKGEWKLSTIKRMNKKSARVCINENNTELTAKFEEIRFPVTLSTIIDVNEELELTPPVQVGVTGVTEVETMVQEETIPEETEMEVEPVTEMIPDIVEEIVMEAESEAVTIEEACCLVDEVITEQKKAEPENKEEVKESEESNSAKMMDVEEIQNESETSSVAAAPESTEELQDTTHVAIPTTEIAVAASAPPTPLPIERNSMSWNSCTKFSLQDSAMKNTDGMAAKPKARRNARRSAMKQLAESMRQETIQDEQQAASMDEEVTEAEIESVIDVDAVKEISTSIASTPAIIAPTTTTGVVAPNTSAVLALPTPLPVVIVPSPTAASESSASQHKEMLPRMNKAQAMRLEAIQKKIVTSDTNPTSSTAFTAAANRPTPTPMHVASKRNVVHTAPRHSVAHTPAHHRSSISTSASSTTQLKNRPKHLQSTPLAPTPSSAKANRLSMQVGITSGNKRKLSDSFDSRSHSANAPDFKRMHNKQFSTLKSIAECVDQDKTVAARMTTEMESAMKKQSTSSSSAPLKPAADIAKPAANPFNKVLNKASHGTPSKVRSTGATPLGLSSRPTGSSSSNSANIIKSRTVTSFVPAGASSCGSKMTSFLNKENAPGSGNVTSFLKSGKESGSTSMSMHKHRSVSLSNGTVVNHGSTKQRLQMN